MLCLGWYFIKDNSHFLTSGSLLSPDPPSRLVCNTNLISFLISTTIMTSVEANNCTLVLEFTSFKEA